MWGWAYVPAFGCGHGWQPARAAQMGPRSLPRPRPKQVGAATLMLATRPATTSPLLMPPPALWCVAAARVPPPSHALRLQAPCFTRSADTSASTFLLQHTNQTPLPHCYLLPADACGRQVQQPVRAARRLLPRQLRRLPGGGQCGRAGGDLRRSAYPRCDRGAEPARGHCKAPPAARRARRSAPVLYVG